MIDHLDKQTQPMNLEPKRGRGRPATGQALSNADRQRAYRERQKAQRNEKGAGPEWDDVRKLTKYIDDLSEQLVEAINRAQAAEAKAKELEKELNEAHLIMAEINGLRRELADEKVKKLKRAAPQKKRYILQFQMDDGTWKDDTTGDYGSKQRATQACKAMNDMLKEKEEPWTKGWRVRERQWV